MTRAAILFLACLFREVLADLGPLVSTQGGRLRGTTLASVRNNNTYYAFMGIPYAKPPVGHLRFQPPEVAEGWRGVRNATTEGSMCPQLNFFNNTFEGNEDCLYLNVYTPQLPPGPPLPVMVWIHGGAFVTGSSSKSVYGPDYLIQNDVILVTFNYRLGLLGFLSLQTPEAPGNNGIKDQVLALKWVQRNIRSFGGDPHDVTIFGQSSGAASVHYHILSPLSKGLFHRAIAQSGCALDPWAFQSPTAAVKLAREMGGKLGLRNNDSRHILDRLRAATAQWIVQHLNHFKSTRGALVGPTVDYVAGNGKAFLPDTPINLIRNGKFQRVPFIIGVNSEEGIVEAARLKELKWLLLPVTSVFQVTLPYVIGPNLRDAYKMAVNLEKKYFNNTKPLLLQYMDVITDFYFVNGMYCTAKEHAMFPNSSIFVYQFKFDGTANVLKKILGGEEFPGACHGDDIPYLFPFESSNVRILPGSEEYLTSERMVKLWTNFAKTGNPTPGKDPLLQNRIWRQVGRNDFPLLTIDKDLKIKHRINSGHPAWWQMLYKNFTRHETPCWPKH